MTNRHGLGDGQFGRIALLPPARPGTVGRDSVPGNRLFVEAVIWRFRCGLPRRDMPLATGAWKNTRRRFSRRGGKGVRANVFKSLADEPGNEYAMIDATVVRARQHGAGAPKKAVSTKPSGVRAADRRPKSMPSPMLRAFPRPSA